jgi:hypothetical protein
MPSGGAKESIFILKLITHERRCEMAYPRYGQETILVYEAESGEWEGGNDKISSFIEFKESYYNQVDEDSAKVTVIFNHAIRVQANTTRTENKMTLNLEHIGGKWKINDYTVEQTI